MQTNPILLEVFRNRFAAIAEEMGVTLTRTAFSPNIKERRDLSCAVFDASGDMIAQAAHIPVHLGSMPLSVKAAIDAANFGEGDMVMLNDPFRGGTHLPDITLVAPVFHGPDRPSFFVACRAHHADVGGMTSGSMPLSTSLFQEGLVIPPVTLVRGGRIVDDVMGLVLANVRTPLEREGDFSAIPWITYPILLRSATGSIPAVSWPSMRMTPPEGSTSLFIIRRMVVFPHPEGPIRTSNSPLEISISTPRTTSLPPYLFVTPSRLMAEGTEFRASPREIMISSWLCPYEVLPPR